MTKDTLSEILTRIRNAIYVKQDGVEVPRTRMTRSLANILLQEGLLREVLISPPAKQDQKSSMFLRLK
jgi:small subunit ribosomal protein S8